MGLTGPMISLGSQPGMQPVNTVSPISSYTPIYGIQHAAPDNHIF
jgi:hypothetical protein